MRINAITRQAVNEYVAHSRVSGKDLGEVLDRAGVLVTPERLRTVQAAVLEDVIELLASATPGQFTYRTTQQDLLNGIRTVLESQAKELRSR